MEDLHWILIITVICGILVFQIRFFSETIINLKIFRRIFPKSPNEVWTILRIDKSDGESVTAISTQIGIEIAETEKEIDSLAAEISQLTAEIDRLNSFSFLVPSDQERLDSLRQTRNEKSSDTNRLNKRLQELKQKKSSDNDVQESIINSINSYLERNGDSASDFNLIKDIVDRNTDAVDDEIQTQIPFPLYLGLMGTMLGILIGVGYLVFSGGLDQLINTVEIGAQQTDLPITAIEPSLINTVEIGAQQTDGIKALLGGVALAMVCSIIGILFTTIGSNRTKKIKAEVETNKHSFLSWLQAELLPVMNRDAISVMRQVTDNLSQFNNEFSANTANLSETLSTVSDATENQVRLLEQVNQLRPTRLATANVQVYQNLKNCSDEIGRIGDALQNSADYLAKVRELSDKLDEHQELLRTIQEMTEFFRETREGMSGMINRSIGKSEETLNEATQTFIHNIGESYNNLNRAVSEHQQELEELLTQENRTLQTRLNEFTTLVNEIKNLSAVKSSMDKLQKETEAQNKKIDKLSDEIRNLAQVKASGGSISTKLPLQKYEKIALYIVGGVLTLAGLLFVVLIVLALFGIL